MDKQTQVKQTKFLAEYHRTLQWAEVRVGEQEEKGENNHAAIPDMFPHGLSDLSFMIHTKAERLVGYEITGNLLESLDEARDIINYAAFYIAYYRTVVDPPISEDKGDL